MGLLTWLGFVAPDPNTHDFTGESAERFIDYDIINKGQFLRGVLPESDKPLALDDYIILRTPLGTTTRYRVLELTFYGADEYYNFQAIYAPRSAREKRRHVRA